MKINNAFKCPHCQKELIGKYKEKYYFSENVVVYTCYGTEYKIYIALDDAQAIVDVIIDLSNDNKTILDFQLTNQYLLLNGFEVEYIPLTINNFSSIFSRAKIIKTFE